MRRLEALAVGQAGYAIPYFYSRMKKREALTAIGSRQGGFLIFESAVPHSGMNFCLFFPIVYFIVPIRGPNDKKQKSLKN